MTSTEASRLRNVVAFLGQIGPRYGEWTRQQRDQLDAIAEELADLARHADEAPQ